MGDLMRPAPRRSFAEHVVALARWIGIGRIVAVLGSIAAVAIGAVWLLRAPDAADPGRAEAVPTAPAPTLAAVPPGTAQRAEGNDPGSASSPATSTAPPPTTAARVIVHVAGAVVAAGVYELPGNSRVSDAVAVAGGADADAALDAVNLAAPVVDGQQVYVPRLGEASGPAPATSAAVPAAGAPAGPSPIDLNTATETELLALPGVGPVLAAAIVRHRELAGPFASVDALIEVPGIGPARLASLRELVRV